MEQSTVTRERAPAQEDRTRTRLGALSMFAAVYTYALIVFGGIVRITGSGMGCGDDWPRCNGEWIPTFTLETLIEYVHRLLAAGIGFVLLAVFVYAWMHRHRAGIGGKGGAFRPLVLGAVLLVFQIVLGAITVRLELPTAVTVLHFVTALLFMGTLIVSAVRSGILGDAPARAPRDASATRHAFRSALAALGVGGLVVTLGALTANMPGAPMACLGFPLCNGNVLPPDAAVAHVHWTHRLLAFALLGHVLFAVPAARRRGASSAVVRAASATRVLILLQIAVAAALVLLFLPAYVQALHLAVGAAIWFALVVWTTLAHRDVRA